MTPQFTIHCPDTNDIATRERKVRHRSRDWPTIVIDFLMVVGVALYLGALL